MGNVVRHKLPIFLFWIRHEANVATRMLIPGWKDDSMLTFSILWVMLAAAITVIATMRQTASREDQGAVQVSESDKGSSVIAVISCLVLLAGFIYITWQNGLALIK